MLPRVRALVLVLVPACFHPNYEQVRCGTGDTCPSGLQCNTATGFCSPDGPGGSDGCTSFALLVNTCALSFESNLAVNGAASYDTDAHVLVIGGAATPFALKTVMIGTDQVDVISAHDVHLGVSAHLRATGSHGLAIIASNDFRIDTDAQIDVSGGGAGARTSCPNGATKGQDSTSGAGGGGGGGFGDSGGNGGDGNHDGTPSAGGLHGSAEPSFPTGFHGGCPGADGGAGNGKSGVGGAGGSGGGALYVVAAGRMVFGSSAPLNAGGSGGKGGGHAGTTDGDAGGGGGGSGGLLLLEAPHILASGASVVANGGSGGEGSDRNGLGGNGAPGTLTTGRAPGGSGGAVTGSDGGDGGSAMGTAGLSVTEIADGGGGGGGGGVGFIRIRSADTGALVVSPPPS